MCGVQLDPRPEAPRPAGCPCACSAGHIATQLFKNESATGVEAKPIESLRVLLLEVDQADIYIETRKACELKPGTNTPDPETACPFVKKVLTMAPEVRCRNYDEKVAARHHKFQGSLKCYSPRLADFSCLQISVVLEGFRHRIRCYVGG